MRNSIVYTYYEEILNFDSGKNYNQKQIIELCKKSWEKSGWELVVLDSNHAKKHPIYEIYNKILRELPSVNPSEYDHQCYIRWLAMVVVGGGFMIDYDVMNIDVSPNLLNDIISSHDGSKLSILQGHVPCVVYGSENQYLNMCHNFIKLRKNLDCIISIEDKPHTSDMIMLAKGLTDKDVNKIHYVKNYSNDMGQGLIHCSQNLSSKNKLSKKEMMLNILNNI